MRFKSLNLLCLILLASWAMPTLLRAEERDEGFAQSMLSGAPDAALGLGLITLWGVDRWKWFEQPMHAKDEHGFSSQSKTGGSDKTGHFGSAYLVSELLSSRMEDRGYSPERAALVGATYSAALMTWIEIGDATSRYGFSVEDLLADYLGVGLGYMLRTTPTLRSKLDLRLEYRPTSGYGGSGDIVADYSGMKHVAAVKLGGFEAFQASPLRYFEIHLGYYSRGYRSFDQEAKQRVLYTAVGIDLAELLAPHGFEGVRKGLRYVQIPYTYAPYPLIKEKEPAPTKGTGRNSL